MAIKQTDPLKGTVTIAFAGRVVRTRTYHATRNMSDTLDYSDFRTVEVTEALVYLGREATEETRYVGPRLRRVGDAIPVHERFVWTDCSNHFTWRGCDHKVPEVDADLAGEPEMAEDLAAYDEHVAAVAKRQAEMNAAREQAELAANLEAERNRPERGKRMVVAKGRKVPVGLVGTVSYVSGSGSVLLKADHEWQDRQAQGTWVDGSNLRAR